jgi:transposase InsO family protein
MTCPCKPISIDSAATVSCTLAGSNSSSQTALRQRQPRPDFLHHSDRGRQYVSFDYQSLLVRHKASVSMSRRSNCFDNAPVENFFASLKAECVRGAVFTTHNQAQTALSEYIEVLYNGQWLHSQLDYRTPVEIELMSTVS